MGHKRTTKIMSIYLIDGLKIDISSSLHIAFIAPGCVSDQDVHINGNFLNCCVMHFLTEEVLFRKFLQSGKKGGKEDVSNFYDCF